jgi:hypothetical protein
MSPSDDPSPTPPFDRDAVVFTAYHAGGATQLVDPYTIASSFNATVEQIDVPLAEAVDAGLLTRQQDPATVRIAFRVAPAGVQLVETDERE